MKKIKVVWCILSIVLMALIFFFSHQPANVSSDTSGKFAKILAEFLGLLFRGRLYEQVLWLAQLIVRKSAHLVLFTMLGIFVYNTFDISGRERFVIALAICILYALGDEFHQSFVPGRACRLSDVFIDSVGSTAGIAIAQVKRILHKKEKRWEG